jgi:hypothetical protein
MASFVSGLMQGGADEATSLKESGKKGLLRRKKKAGPTMTDSPIRDSTDTADPATAKRGAKKVKKGGWMKVHKNERVLTPKQARRMSMKEETKKKGRGRKGRSKSR